MVHTTSGKPVVKHVSRALRYMDSNTPVTRASRRNTSELRATGVRSRSPAQPSKSFPPTLRTKCVASPGRSESCSATSFVTAHPRLEGLPSIRLEVPPVIDSPRPALVAHTSNCQRWNHPVERRAARHLPRFFCLFGGNSRIREPGMSLGAPNTICSSISVGCQNYSNPLILSAA